MADTTFHSLTLPGQDTARVPSMAEEFTTETNYEVKDYCTYQGKLYRCIATHSAGAWNAAHFTATDVDAEFDRKLDIPTSQASAPANPRVGDLWIDNDENSPIYNVDTSPTLNSTNAVQSGGTKTALNAIDSRKVEHGCITGDFSASVDYRVGDLVFYATTANGITTRTLYRCTTAHNAAAWNAAHFTATTLEVELQKVRDSEADTDMIGDLFGSKTTYAIGDYCIYNDNLYRCIREIDNSSTNAPAFDPDDWIQIKLANEVNELKNAIKPQVIEYDIGSLIWESAHTLSTSGIYTTSTIRVASSSYVYITEGTTIKVNPGYVVRCASYSAVDFETGINAFTFRELIKDFTTGDIVIPYSSYYRFAVGLSGSGAATVSDGTLAFGESFAKGLSVAGNTITNILTDVDVTNGITLTSSGSVALNENMITTDFIPVAENNIYYLNIMSKNTDVYTTVYTRVIFYDAAKTFSAIARKFNFATSASQIFDIREIINIPSGVQYMRICYPTVGVSAISLGCYGAYDQTARNLLYKIGQDTQTLHKEKYAVKRNNPDMVQQMIAVAESYLNQKSGNSYIMHYGTATPLSTTYQNDKAIDCSTFIGFVLRGIDFQDSPYLIDYPPEDLNPFDPSQFVANPDYLWSINPAKYEYNLYQDAGDFDLAEARRASQIAEMFADQGREIPIDKYYANIELGDLLFFAKKDDDGKYLESYRYRHITHVALVINVEDAPQDATWDTTLYPYKHTYIDVSGGAGTDPVRVNVLEEAPVSETVYGLGTLTCVMRPDIGNITMLNAVTDLSNEIANIQSMIATVESATTASQNYAVGDAFIHAGALYKATASIASGDAIIPGTNCTQTTLISIIKGT